MGEPCHVLLIDPPWLGEGARWWDRAGSAMPGLALPCLAAWLERGGHSARILDCQALGLTLAELPALLAREREPQLVGITTMTPIVPNALAIAGMCRRVFPDAMVVMGGAHASVLPEELLEDEHVDFAVRGEGERTLGELAEGRAPAEIVGLSYREESGIRHNPDRPLIDELDELPLPAYHLLPLERYRPGLGTYRQLPATSMLTTRGCASNCEYCFKLFGRRMRRRSSTRVVEDIRQLKSRFGIRQIQFYDDSFTAHRRALREFCQEMTAAQLEVSWTCYGRVDGADAELLALMARAGCHQICYGIESGDAATLASIGKRIQLDQVRRVVRWTRAAGIEPRGTFMFGNRGETKASMERTLQLALSLDLDVALFSVATPYPGTELFRWAEKGGHLLTRDWAQYDRAHAVLRLPSAAPEVVWAYHRRAYRRFYLRPRFLARRALRLRSRRQLKEAFQVFRGVFGYR